MRDARPAAPSPRRRSPLTRRAAGLVPLLAAVLVGAGVVVPASAATTLTGQISFAPGAAPDAMSELTVLAVDPVRRYTTTSGSIDAAGRYTVRADGPVAVLVMTPSGSVWSPEYHGGAYSLADATVVRPGSAGASYDVELDVGGSISGRLTVPPGTDATEWTVWTYVQDGDHAAQRAEDTPVAADGSYTVVGRRPGPHAVYFSSAHGTELWGDADGTGDVPTVPVELGRTTTGVDARVRFEPHLWGTDQWVVSGSPLPMTASHYSTRADLPPTGEVRLLRGDDVLAAAPSARTMTLPGVDLPVGDHALRLVHPGDDWYRPSEDAVTVHVRPDVPPVLGAAVLRPAPAGDTPTYRVEGAGFTSDVRVTVGGVDASVVVVSDTELRLTLPDLDAVGAVPLVLTAARRGSEVTATGSLTLAEVAPVTPLRRIDTDAGGQVCRGVAVPAAGRATGAFVNVTASAPEAPGYVVAQPDDGSGAPALPSGSTVNLEPGRDTANATFVPLGPDGRVCVTPRSGGHPGRVILDVTAYTRGDAGIVGIPSARVLDTRPGGVGEVDGAVRPRTRHTIQVAGRGGVPADAAAVLLNVTSTQVTAHGNLRVFPAGPTVPTTSTVNYVPGVDKANGTLVELVDGKLSFWSDSAGTAHVLLDVLGYTTRASTLTAAPTPTRVLDTRAASRVGPLDAPLPARTARSVPLAGVGPVPADATAVLLNVTAIGTRGVGNLRVYPDTAGDGTTPPPDASTLNYIVGRDIPNQVLVQLPESGRVALYSDTADGPVHVAADVVGWVTGSATGR